MQANIVDTTLRDGEQSAGIALKASEKVQIANLLNSLGVYQIEAGIPAMGGEEKRAVQKIAGLNLRSRISSWNRMNLTDIRHSMDCDVDIIHVSVPSSDIQIETKFGRNKEWVVDNLKRCISFVKEKGFEITVGLEDASRADFRFILQLIATCFLEGVKRVRYADTAGIQYRQRIFDEISRIRNQVCIDLEMNAHNDLGMAVSNSITAVKAGAEYVDCTIGGIGERAGNCDFARFVAAAKGCLGLLEDTDAKNIEAVQKDILRIIKAR
jgi:homocitrate synthase NifV